MRVLILGQNPSKKNTNPNLPFKGTKSGNTLDVWLASCVLMPHAYDILNLSNDINAKFDANKLKIYATTIKITCGGYDKYIALGNIPSKVLTLAGIEHFRLPHPSGRNRKLNDKQWLTTTLEKCKKYVWSDD